MRDLSKDLVGMGSGDSKVYASMQLDLEVARFYSRQNRASEVPLENPMVLVQDGIRCFQQA